MASTGGGKLKLHRRSLELGGERYTVLSARPATAARFATTTYHQSWHILCDSGGADLLGRLSWAMAFQTRPHTMLLIDLPLIAPDPFGTGPASPIAIVNSDVDAPSAATIEALVAQLPLAGAADGSVRLTTAGFDRAVADVDRFWTQERDVDPAFTAHSHARWVEPVGGAVVLAAPAPVLRQWAVRVAELAARGPLAPGWTPADEQRWTGEVKVLAVIAGEPVR